MPPDSLERSEVELHEATPAGFSLGTILDDDNENLEHPDFKDKPEGGWDEETKEEGAAQGFCIECEGTH